MRNSIIIGACWDGSDYYPVEYVNILYRSVKRHTTIPFNFVLYAGKWVSALEHRLDPAIDIIYTGMPYWWGGMGFWSAKAPGIKTETLLYLDLDLVILNNIDDIINYPSTHCYMKDYPIDLCPVGKEHDGNASVVLFRYGAGDQVWQEYVKAGKPEWSPFNPPADRLFPLAAQGICNDFKIKHDLFPQDWVISYKLQAIRTGIPADCKIVSFHGKPKPHECSEQWVKDNWR